MPNSTVVDGSTFGGITIVTSGSSNSAGSLTTTLHDLLPSDTSGSSRPSTSGGSSYVVADMTSVDVELVENEATTVGDVGLSTEEMAARREKQRLMAIDDASLSVQDKWRLGNVLRGAMPFGDLTVYSQNLHSARSITLLLISTFSDFQAERHYLHTEVFPDMRDQLRGEAQVDLNVLDIWLGVDDEKSVTPLDWHNFANFLIGQGKTGTPLICVFLSGHKYGQPVISPIFEENAAQILAEFCSSDPTTSQLLTDALWPDIAQMPQDIVDPKSVKAVAPEKRRFILRQEVLGAGQIHALSYLIASASVKRPELMPFVSSGPELLFDVLANNFNPNDASLIILSRRIVGLRDNAHLPVCRPYCDLDADSPADFCQIRLKLFQEKLCRLAPEMTNRLNMELKISDLNGVNCERHAKFNKHLADSGKLLYCAVKECGVVNFFRKNSPSPCVTGSERDTTLSEHAGTALDQLVREATVHLMYAHEHAANCVGRRDILTDLLIYVTNHESNTNTFCKPLAILGSVGSGQSTLMSAAVLKVIENAFPGDSGLVCIPRFAKLTPQSSDLKSTLRGMLLHLSYVIGGSTRANRELSLPDDISSVKNRFIHELQTLKQSVRVIFFLDGFHTLQRSGSSSGFGDFIDFLPSVLSERVRVIVGLKKENEEAVTHFAARYGDRCIITIEDFSPAAANELLKAAFVNRGQHLMFSQWQALRMAVDSIADANGGGVSAPYLSLIREGALRWHTFTSISPSYFGYTVEEELHRIFSLFELRNGTTFTKHTLAYLTAARHRGLSLAELSDVLALDNFVLHALEDGETGIGHFASDTSAVESTVYSFTSARVPTLALYRLLFEVNPFLAQRTVDSLAVIVWADTLVANFAEARYLHADGDLARMVNSNLAEFYLGSWGGRTPKDLRLSVCDTNTNSQSDVPKSRQNVFSQGKAVRFVVRQPLSFSQCRTPEANEANVRRLMCLPWYLLAAHRHRDLFNNVLFNLEWLLAKLPSMGVDKTLADFYEAVAGIRRSNLISPTSIDEIAVVRDSIRFSRAVLEIRPNFLPNILLARLLVFVHSARLATLYKNVCALLNQCDCMTATDRRNALVPVMSCLDTPGSPLIYTGLIRRKNPMTVASSPLNVMPIQSTYAYIVGLKLDVSTSARFWSGCGCGSLGTGWFCAPIQGLPKGPFFKLNTPGGRLFAAIGDKQILKIYHIESGELVYSVDLMQQIEVKQLTSTDRFIVIVPGLTTIASLNGPPNLEGNKPASRPVASGSNNSVAINGDAPQTAVTQPTGPIIVDMLHRAVAHRFAKRPEMAAISSENDFFAFTADEEIFLYQLPLMECVHSFRTEMPPVYLYIVPQSVHCRSDEVRLVVVTNHGSVVLAIVNKKVAKSIFKPVLPYRESLLNPVMQVDTVRGGAMGLLESPSRLFLISLRDGSLLEELPLPSQIPAPRRFTAASFACSDQVIASALDTGHICLFRIGGDASSLRIINPSIQSTNPFNGQIISHLYGPTCCWRVMALSTNGDATYLRCWDVERLSSLSHIVNYSHVVAPGNVLGLFPPTPYVDGIEESSPMAVGLLSQPISNNTQQCCLQVLDLKSCSVGTVGLNFTWSQRVARVILSPDASFCLVVNTEKLGVLYTTNVTGRTAKYDYCELGSFSGVTDAFFTSPKRESGRLFETIFVVISEDSLIEVYRLGYGKVELLHERQTRLVRCPLLLPETRTLCFLTTEANPHRTVEDVKLAIFRDVSSLNGAIETYHLYEIWRVEGNGHWELAEIMPIGNSPNQILVLFTVAELSAVLYPMLRRENVACFALNVENKEMVWSSLGRAAFLPNSPVTPESLFLPRSRLPFLIVDSQAKLACDVDLGTVYNLPFGTRAKIQLSTPCCVESFRFMLEGNYFCVLSSDRRKVMACRTSDEHKMAEFELFGIANCLEVIPCRHPRSDRRVITVGMEDGRLVALTFVADLCDPVFENLVQFRKSR